MVYDRRKDVDTSANLSEHFFILPEDATGRSSVIATSPLLYPGTGGGMDYGSTKWKKKRQKILAMDGYRCQIARRYGRIEEAVIVHHIYPAKDFPEWQYATWNLISVSRRTHELLEDRRTGELTELGKDLQRRTIPGVDWRKKRTGAV